ncbi:MAG: hypothetical protein ACQETH_02340 [Candidatus Rifleibacteriota bacterium]
MELKPPPGTLGSSKTPQKTSAATQQEVTPPKCFGTDYFGKWNQTGMTFESMKIDRPEYQLKCANCPFFERCYMCNHIRLIKIKR